MSEPEITGNEPEATNSYDEVPYESKPFPETHPARLASIGRLFGLEPVATDNCRVLEMGCASGGNLIPMAMSLPQAEFVGVEQSGRQWEMAQKTISDLGLANVEIKQASIMDVDESYGSFDYIITHGVFSWVPPEVQQGILRVSSRNLSDNGIAYVSYNTYPGWRMRGMVRELMMYHTRQFTDAKKRVAQARALIDFLAGAVPVENNYYGLLLKSELEAIRKSTDSYIFHEHLEDENIPVYFHEFATMAATEGLRYLGEMDFGTMLARGFPESVSATLNRISGDIIRTEQYMDFVRNRMFRKTILCKSERKLTRNVTPQAIASLLFSSCAKPETDFSLSPDKRLSFKTPRGYSVETNRALSKAALNILLQAWPKSLPLDDLFEQAKTMVLESGDEAAINQAPLTAEQLAADLLVCFTSNTVEIRASAADFTLSVSEKPRAWDYAAYQSRQAPTATNMRHELVGLDMVERHLVPVLDGEKDHEMLLEHLMDQWEKGVIVVRRDDNPIMEKEAARQHLKNAMVPALERIAKKALLIA